MNGTIRRMILVAAGGLLGLATAVAQPPAPGPVPTAPLLPAVIVPTPVKPQIFGATEVVGPLAVSNVYPGSAAAAAMAAGPAPVTGQAPAGGYVTGGGCGPSGSYARRAWDAATIGPGCANPVTCGNWATERTFLFGSCCQFFNPGNKCGTGGGGFGLGYGRCAASPAGCGNLGTYNTCSYGSYVNR